MWSFNIISGLDRFQFIPFVEDAWNFFYFEMTNVIDKHAPIKTIKELMVGTYLGSADILLVFF